MRTRVLLFFAALLAAESTSVAQGTPRMELGGVYLNTSRIFGPTCHGGGGSLAINVNRWLGFVGEVSGCRSKREAIPGSGFFAPIPEVRGSEFLYLAGPRISYRWRVTPYFQILGGGTHLTSSSPTGLKGNGFAMALGPGFELRITDRFGLRLIQAEYLTRNVAPGRIEDLRISTGVAFAIGQR